MTANVRVVPVVVIPVVYGVPLAFPSFVFASENIKGWVASVELDRSKIYVWCWCSVKEACESPSIRYLLAPDTVTTNVLVVPIVIALLTSEVVEVILSVIRASPTTSRVVVGPVVPIPKFPC